MKYLNFNFLKSKIIYKKKFMDNRWPKHEAHRKRVMNNFFLVEKGTFIKNQT